MRWIEPENYTRKKVDNAGEFLAKNRKRIGQDPEEIINVFNNWRSSHAYPMHILMKSVKSVAKCINKEAICFQRLKRVSSILGKLERYHAMKLSRMQDIAGCRVIMPDVKLTRMMSEEFISRKKRHKRIKSREMNYINNPKLDGYRCIHLIYEYITENSGKEMYNGKMVEIQIRSQLQHSWATAVETVDLFENQKMKFGEGLPKWKRFFALMSSAFAIMEDCPIVENTPIDKSILYSEIYSLSQELDVIDKLNFWNQSINFIDPKEGVYFILVLNRKEKNINVMSEKNPEKIKSFLEEYYSLERKYKNNENYDVVLVGGENIKSLKKAYPNYFADTQYFLSQLHEIVTNVKKQG
jgi:ppGpp synthetase/RelA/SpoT-type nucleotidyltranferase